MVNDANRIEGASIAAHPFSKDGQIAVFSQARTIFAAQAMVGGVIATREGDRRFQAGDWIVTDNPPTHAWAINDQVFKHTYHRVDDAPVGSLPSVPAPAIPKVARATKAAAKTQRKVTKARETAKANGTAKPKRQRPMAMPLSATPPSEPGVDMTTRGKIADSASLGILPSSPEADPGK